MIIPISKKGLRITAKETTNHPFRPSWYSSEKYLELFLARYFCIDILSTELLTVQFWRMVVECEVQVIVMACNEQEAGKHKCECYWTDENERKQAEHNAFLDGYCKWNWILALEIFALNGYFKWNWIFGLEIYALDWYCKWNCILALEIFALNEYCKWNLILA